MSAPRFKLVGRIPEAIPVLGVPVFTDLSTPPGAGATVDRPFLEQRRFNGEPGDAVAVLADDGSTVVALGVGERGKVSADALRRAGSELARQRGSATQLATTLGTVARSDAELTALIEGIGLGAYRYGGAKKDNANHPIEQVLVVGRDGRGAVEHGQASVDAVWAARDWINRPARDLTPTEFARLATEAAGGTAVVVDVWDEERITGERLGGLLGVAAGASEPPRLLRLSYEPAAAKATVALVGKGITFDSGGLSLKTPDGMMTMKSDMGGAAAVIAATIAASKLAVPLRIVTWVAATENMPSGTAIHPGDVLIARNGTSIEVLNTDAEGRLVLADALSLAAEEEPDAIIDVATLTGGQRVALGDRVAAVMGTDTDLVRRVVQSANSAGEPAWELPLVAAYRKQLESQVADLRNVTGKSSASSIMAGLFLKEFTGGRRWAHLDIAGPSWSDTDDAWITRGATGWGTRTLIELLRNWA